MWKLGSGRQPDQRGFQTPPEPPTYQQQPGTREPGRHQQVVDPEARPGQQPRIDHPWWQKRVTGVKSREEKIDERASVGQRGSELYWLVHNLGLVNLWVDVARFMRERFLRGISLFRLPWFMGREGRKERVLNDIGMYILTQMK
jgi:hypothetical protein